MASDNMKHRRLQELGESDFEIVEGQPDIRGWDVKNAGGETIGEVDELILDAQARKVRYMVVDLDDDALDLDDDRKVLIPIGLAQLDEKDDDVLLPNVNIAQVKQLSAYDRDHLDDAAERAICSVLGRTEFTAGQSATDDTAFYNHEHFNDQNLYHRRLLPQHTSGEKTQGMRFQERTGSGSTGLSSYAENSGLRDRSRNTDRMGDYSEEVEDESLLTVGNNRTAGDSDRLSNDLEDERSDRFTEEDLERRNRDSSSDRNRESL